jgi:signal transduction histidine kinase
MFVRFFNLRNMLTLVAIVFITASIFYSNYLAKNIAKGEKIKVQQYVSAVNDLYNLSNTDTKLASQIIVENSKDIPLIQTNEKDSIIYSNFDSAKVLKNHNYLKNKLAELKEINEPIEWQNPLNATQKNYTFYGESNLLKQVRYFPIVQLIVAMLFIIVISIAISTKSKSEQNQVWAGMAKETAHQLGTPISSLEGWMEILKDDEKTAKYAVEMNKDVERLKLVSDRFGKIGSTPVLEETNLNLQVEKMVAYIKKRSPEKVVMQMQSNEENIAAMINPPLFDWVIENLLKNALDSMNGQGAIHININNEPTQIVIDVKDSGKGIVKKNIPKVFNPGFTTKKRGWGLGLSLSKRIINLYHKGDIFVKQSELGKGTTFRIVLKK